MTADINEVVANIRSGDKIGILVYLHHGGDVNARNSMGWTLLHIACFEGKTEIVELLLDNGAQVNSCTTDMRTPLHRASAQGCKGAVAALLSKNAYVNAQDKNGNTALHEAARGAHTSIVKALINNKADKAKVNQRQQTFIDLVGQQVMPLVETGDSDSLLLWLDWGLSPDTCGQIGWSMLHHAAARGQLEIAKMLLKRGANVMLLDGNKSTPLHSSAFHGHKEIAKLLLKEGADPNYQDQRGNTPLHSAVSGSHADIINMLLESQADTSIPNTEGMVFKHIVKDVLVTAVHECKTAQVAALLKGRADPDTRDSDGTPVLCVAAFKKDIMIVDALLEAGADPNLTSADSKKTALHYAAFWEELYIIRALLDHKAKIDVTDKFGGTPMHEAAREGHVDVITMLTGRLAAVNIADEDGNTPLHVAARAGQTDVVELLLEKGCNDSIRNKDGLLYSDLALIHAVRTEVADKVMSGLAWGGDPNSKDHRRWTLLHHAVYKGSLEITSLLLECEADVNAVANHGRTPLLLAAYRGNCAIISKLLSAGAALDSQDWEGQTALHWAAREGSVDAVLLLIDGGADTSVEDKQGRRFTSWLVKHLYLAVRHNDSEKVALLLDAGADQFTRVDGTDVTPREEAKRRKCYVILRQLAAHAPPGEPFEQPDYWDLPTIEDLRLLFKGRGDDGGSSSDDSEDEAEWKMENADVVLSAKDVFADDNETLWEVWDEKPKWVTAKELFQEDIQDFWESWEEKPKIVSAKEFFKEDEKPWWDENVDEPEGSSSHAVEEGESESDSEDSQVTETVIETEFERQCKKGSLISAKDFFKEDDNWWSDNLESLDEPKAISAKDFFKEDTPWWETEDGDYDGDCNDDDDTTEAESTEEESSSLTPTSSGWKKENAISAKEFFKEDECWWRDAVEDMDTPKVISAKDFFKEDQAWWEKPDEDTEFSSEKAIPAKDFFKEEDAWWEDKDDTDQDTSLTDDEAYESIISDTSTMFSASEGASSDQYQECDWWLSPENSEATSAVIKAKDLFKEEAWWDESSETSEGTDTKVSESTDIPDQVDAIDKDDSLSSTSDSDSEETQAESIVEEDADDGIGEDRDIQDGDSAVFVKNDSESSDTDQESEPEVKSDQPTGLNEWKNEGVREDDDVISQEPRDISHKNDLIKLTKTSVDNDLRTRDRRNLSQNSSAENSSQSGKVSPDAADASDDDDNDDNIDDDETCFPHPSANECNADSLLKTPAVESSKVDWSVPNPSLLTQPNMKSFDDTTGERGDNSTLEDLDIPLDDTEVIDVVISFPKRKAQKIVERTPSSEQPSRETSSEKDNGSELEVKTTTTKKRDILRSSSEAESFEIVINKMDECLARLDARIAEVDSQLYTEVQKPEPDIPCDKPKKEVHDLDKTSPYIKRNFEECMEDIIQNTQRSLAKERERRTSIDGNHSPSTNEPETPVKIIDNDGKISNPSCDQNNAQKQNDACAREKIRELADEKFPQATPANEIFQVFKVNVRMPYNDIVLSTESNDMNELDSSSSTNKSTTPKENNEQSKIFDELVQNLLTEDTKTPQTEDNCISANDTVLDYTRDEEVKSKNVQDTNKTSMTNVNNPMNSLISDQNEINIIDGDDKTPKCTANLQKIEISCNERDTNIIEDNLLSNTIPEPRIETNSKEEQIVNEKLDSEEEHASDQDSNSKIRCNHIEMNDMKTSTEDNLDTPTVVTVDSVNDNLLKTNRDSSKLEKSEDVDSGGEGEVNEHPEKEKNESQSGSECDEQKECRSLCVSREQSIEKDILDQSPPKVELNKGIWRCSTYEPITISEFDHMAFMIGRSASFHGDLRTNNNSDSEVRTSKESLLNEPYNHPSESSSSRVDKSENYESNHAKVEPHNEETAKNDIVSDLKNYSQSRDTDKDSTKSDPKPDRNLPCTSSVNLSPPVTPRRSKDLRRCPLPSDTKPAPVIITKVPVGSSEITHKKYKCESGEGNVVISGSVPKTPVCTASSVSPPVGPPSSTPIANARPAAPGAVNQSRPQPRRPDNVRKSSSCALT